MKIDAKKTIGLGCLLLSAAFAGHAQTPAPPDTALPTGAVQRGTLTSEQLRSDAMPMAAAAAATKGCKDAADLKGFEPFMATLPQGAQGERVWSEIWVFTCSAAAPEVRIDFRETADGGADYSVKMN